ncbi:Ctr copper transporter [Wallemia mellicola CBS 633.66]|uniref:Copper transport protein n=1 Tax=Wallemia mellicola (strain ATCC MYA-4683 / CBS 633.66) TaxID=671144 RepID=I4Y8E8_WALMC|nr:Ctr copper transporter [Wallemia mellicola CBS 633.66]EIM20240.1 Ctr copper transporter [Wallemia mellicola CBS 633.66]|eukprot:XP_006959728.1 Ctr copper transporter [Wallemia mellicola CBS 633.66]
MICQCQRCARCVYSICADICLISLQMDMLWNWDVKDRCIVFSSWQISSAISAIFSIITIILLGVLFEWLKYRMRKLDTSIANSLAIAYNIHTSYKNSNNLNRSAVDIEVDEPTTVQTPAKLIVPKHQQVQRSILYAASAALSFFLMLIFMTYNGFLIAAVVVGAGLGHYTFHREIEVAPSNESSSALGCHL